jgi:hypothetical protein
MKEFINFLVRLANHLGVETGKLNLPTKEKEQAELASRILNEINKYFYQQTSTLPNTYTSQFHSFWQQYHATVLAPVIDPRTCLKVAQVLEGIFRTNDIKIGADTIDLTKEQIAQARFFTAIQDFKIDINRRGNPFQIYKKKPECFDPKKILQNHLLVDTFLNLIGADAQRDKRKTWMLKSAQLLVTKYAGSALRICDRHGRDAAEIRAALTITESYGFSKKKADMLLRDLADLGVWSYLKNADEIDVMSDANTMRIALRTGILRLRIPLLASYLDIHGHQYSLIGAKNSDAWREVWHQWRKIRRHHRPPTPASMDYLIFRMGKLSCRKSTRKCPPESPASQKKIESLIRQDQLLYDRNGFCIFSGICPIERKPLQPPKAISIWGQTGWISGRTNEGGGGGISS